MRKKVTMRKKEDLENNKAVKGIGKTWSFFHAYSTWFLFCWTNVGQDVVEYVYRLKNERTIRINPEKAK